MNKILTFYISLAALVVTSCNLQNQLVEEPVAVTATPDLAVTTTAVEEDAQASSRELTLSVWAPSFFAQPEAGPGSDVLAEAYEAFVDANSGIDLIVHPKPESGSSDFQSYIRSASKVAPTILPDIILIEMQSLWPLIEEFSLQPLSEKEISFQLDDAYPFAQNAVRFNQRVYGIPYAASIIHMVYARPEFQDEAGEAKIPNSWSELLSSNTTYLFPATGQNRMSSDMLLLQYVGAGGQLTPDGTIVNTEALTALFNFMAGGAESGLFPAENREMSTERTAWEKFVADPRGMVNVRSELYLSQRGAMTNTDYASIPTRSGLAVTIGRVWAFAIITDDTGKRALAIDLISRLRAPKVHGVWSQSANLLPTHIESLNSWVDNQPYYDFLRQQMDIALSLPNSESFAELSRQIQSVHFSVLDAQMSATDAVNEVLKNE